MMGKRNEKTEERIVHKLRTVDYNQLMWKQTGFGVREFEFWSGKDLVGVLYWPKWLSDYAVADCGDGKWILDRIGFFRDRAEAIKARTEEQLASVSFNWVGDSELLLSNGRRYQLFKTGFLSNNWTLSDENENVVYKLREGTRWFKHDAEVNLQVGAIMLKELPLLIFLGWYLAYMSLQDAAAAAVAASAAS
jgi:hypothetical protein